MQVDMFVAPFLEAKVEVALLGPLVVTRDGVEVEVTGPKRRALLTLLAIELGTTVSVDQLVDALWSQRTTGREEATLRVHVSYLRDLLEPERSGEPQILLTRGPGYLLSPELVTVDVDRFDHLVEQARSALPEDPAHARSLVDEALALWRGRPLQDVEYEQFAQDQIRSLDRTRQIAVELRAESLIEMNADAAAVDDLEVLVRHDPTGERPVLLLMRALYRTGRQADALRVARRHARGLAELGLEPTPQVRLLEERILTHDPSLLSEDAISPADIGVGRSIRGYEIRDEAGAGSVGVVYRAFQSSVGREVAIKVIHPNLAHSAEFVRRFAEEARMVASLEHPHILPLYDFWRDPFGAFLVMRWLEGGNLSGRVRQSWTGEELTRILGPLSDALAFAHSAGVVHRDIKPANVLFDAGGNAYLADFGLAVVGLDTGVERAGRATTLQPPYASPEVVSGEPPSVASDIYALGVILAQMATGGHFGASSVPGDLGEIVRVATAADPGDRYPDALAFRSALESAIGPVPTPGPRRVRRNPYKGLESFTEADRADFYGREDVVEALLDLVGSHMLSAVIGASGSGKSSVALAGVIPVLREGSLPGSEEWVIVSMVPGADPFDEFSVAVRGMAVGPAPVAADPSREISDGFAAALDGPHARGLLIIDQFEELFSSEVDEAVRRRFLDNLVAMASDPVERVRVVVTLRADFADRALAHPRLGELISQASLLLPPMRPEQVEDVIRRPAARVGVQVEPGLVSEIVRDVLAAPASLPLLQYVLSELFERRTQDRLTVSSYRALGRVEGVLERRAEVVYASLGTDAQAAARQLFLRMVQLGDHGEETRRRLPLTELAGLGRRSEVDAALDAFSEARLLTFDRDPVSRTPTVEVAHEMVIQRWARYRVWIDEARAELASHRRLASAAAAWAEAGEDPAYLLTGGPLVSALEVAASDRIGLNQLEARFVEESQRRDERARQVEERRRLQEADLRQKARRRLTLGLGAVAVAAVVALLAGFALVQRQRANELAQEQERQSLSRSMATASINNLDSDPELSLLLALEAAELSLDAGDDVLPEVVDALHQAVIAPKSELLFEEGATQGTTSHLLLDWSADGSALAVVAEDGGVTLLDPASGEERGRLGPLESPVMGVEVHPTGNRILTIHADAAREWSRSSQEVIRELPHPGGVSTAAYSSDGATVAVGGSDGTIHVWREVGPPLELAGHEDAVSSLSVSPEGDRLVSAGGIDGSVLVWDLVSGEVVVEGPGDPGVPITQVVWAPGDERIAVIRGTFDLYLFNAVTGERGSSFSSVNTSHVAADIGPGGAVLASAAVDGFTRLYVTGGGGAPILEIPNGGVPLRDVAIDRSGSLSTTVATLDTEGRVRIWRDPNNRSELPARSTGLLSPHIAAADDRYLLAGYRHIGGLTSDEPTLAEVIDAATGEVLLRRPTHQHGFLIDREPAISSDGTMVAFPGPGDPGGDIEIVQVDGGSSLVLPESANWTTALAFSEDGRLLAGAGFDGSIAVWEPATGRLIEVLPAESLPPIAVISRLGYFPPKSPATIEDIAFRPGSRQLAWARLDGRIGMWDIAAGEVLHIHNFRHPATTVAYTPDGSKLATADRPGTIAVLDADTGDVVLTPDPVPGLADLSFSPEGRHLAGAGLGPYAFLWDAETGTLLRRFHGSFGVQSSIAFVHGGAQLRVPGIGGIDRGYLIDPENLVELGQRHRSRDLTDAECERYLGRPCGG